MPATDSFTSTATAVTSGVATLTDTGVFTDQPGGPHVEYTRRGFRVAAYNNRVHITKATSFGGSQSALSLPLTLDDARDLADSLLRVTK